MTRGPEGVLLVGHGTRDPVGAEQFLAAARLVRAAMPDHLVEPCFLEIRRPDMAEGFQRLVAEGARRVAVVPLLLLAAGHAKRDIPTIIARLAEEHPGVAIHQFAHLGCHESIMKLSVQRYREALEDRAAIAPNRTLVLLVARGTSDEEATSEMQLFARRRAAYAPVGRVEVCFAAIAKPALAAALAQAATLPYARVVVQPHLLFAGLVLDGVQHAVKTLSQLRRGREWLVTRPLGVTTDVARAAADVVQRVQPRPTNALTPASVEH